MATIYHDAEEIYTLKSGSNPLAISVKNGDGQGGGYFIFKDKKLIGVNKSATIIKGSDCLNQWITVVSAIKDKLEETNWTSVTIFFQEEGEPVTTYGPYKREVAKHLDTVVYTIKIKVLS
jgi:hypothetical protein